jgi:hypothetical protein
LQGVDLARAHAYRAEAFLALKEPQRARTAVIQALGANPAFSVDGADFTDALRQLFAEVRGTRPAVAVPTAAAVPAATGNIHVYSPTQNFLGQSAKIKIECNGRRVAELQNDRVLTIRAEPGAHQIKVHRTTLTVTVAAGADQYVRASLRAFGANVTEVPAAKATAEIEQRTVGLSDTTPECRVPSTAKKPK